MAKVSAGILLFRRRLASVELLLVHPGGPFFKHKDAGAWSIPKGEVIGEEPLLEAARREFEEELGAHVEGVFLPISPVRQKSGKIVHCWACEGDFDPALVKSNTVSMEWPPKSGKQLLFPEVDRAEWFTPEVAREKIIAAQISFIEQLLVLVSR